MNNEETLKKIKEKVDAIIKLSEDKLSNNEEKYSRDEFGKYREIFDLITDLENSIDSPIIKEVNYIYQNSLSIFMDNKINEFLENMNKVKKLLGDPDALKEREKYLAEEIKTPDDYVSCAPEGEVPPKSLARQKRIGNFSNAFILLYPVENSMMVPFDNEQFVRDNYARILKDNQKLMDVKSGLTSKNRKYMYSFVRTGEYLKQTNYEIDLQIDIEGNLLNLKCLFNNFMPSQRDFKLYEGQMNNAPKEGNTIDLVNAATSADGIVGSLMAMQTQNVDTKKINEEYLDEKYDETYPEDALTEARKFIKFIIENN